MRSLLRTRTPTASPSTIFTAARRVGSDLQSLPSPTAGDSTSAGRDAQATHPHGEELSTLAESGTSNMDRLLPRLVEATGFGLCVGYASFLLGMMAGGTWASWCRVTGRPTPGEGYWPLAVVVMVTPLGAVFGFIWSLHRSGCETHDQSGHGGGRIGQLVPRLFRATVLGLLIAYASPFVVGIAGAAWASWFGETGQSGPGMGFWAIAELFVLPLGGVFGFLWSLHLSGRRARHRPDHDPRLHRRPSHRPRSDGRATPG